MITEENISIVLQIATLIGIIFAVYLYFRKPQEESIINDKVFDQKFCGLSEKFDTRFQDMKDGVVKVLQNDLQEVKNGLRDHVSNQGIYERELAGKIGGIDAKLDSLIKK